MSSKRVYYLMISAIVLLVVGLAGGAYELDKVLQKESKTLYDDKLQTEVLSRKQQSLAGAKADLTKYASLEQIAKSVVPQDKDQAEAVREIVKIASDNGVQLGSITFPSSTLGLRAVGSAPGAGKTQSLSQLKPVKNIPGVYNLEITIQSDSDKPVEYNKFLDFLRALEHNRRTAQVNSISLTPDPKRPAYLSFTLILNEYIKP